MAKTINISKNITDQELSIQISLSGLSFCILQRDTHTISFLKHICFKKRLTPFEVLGHLKNAFNDLHELQSTFSNICVIHVNELSTLVPKPLFNEDFLADYLKFNAKILKSDYISYDDILSNGSVNVYVPYVNINNFIYEKFGAFTYKHVSSVLIEQILILEKNSETKKVFTHISSNHFEIIVIDKGHLIFYNTFEYSSKEDFIYYLLFAAEQLQLNPEKLNLVFLGDVVKDDDIYNIAYKYIRNISFGNRFDNYTYLQTPKTSYSDFTLIKNF
jgi:hypothetical protein